MKNQRSTSHLQRPHYGFLALLLFLITAPAQASLIYDLQLTRASDFNGSGQIALNADSGNNTAGVSAFSFTGSSSQGGFSFSLRDIANIEWSIDALTSALTLDIETALIPSATSGVSSCLILQNNNDGYGTCGGVLRSYNSYSRVAQQRIGMTSTGIASLQTIRVQSIPAPAPLALLMAGLIALGITQRKGRGKEA